MNSRYHRRLIVTHIRKLKQTSPHFEVHTFACVYLKIKPDQLPKGALYRKMMQYVIQLSTKHPSETNNNFEKCHLKSIIFWVKKNKTFYNIPIKIKLFCNENNIGLS